MIVITYIKETMLYVLLGFVLLSCQPQVYQDVCFYSNALQTDRWYRIYLPPDYDKNPKKRYPVVYYFHGWGGRYKWSNHDPEEDIYYPDNGRVAPPYVMEWKNYVVDHDVIIITWDGYEPNLHEGRKFREGIKYGGCNPYDFMRAHDTIDHHWGWDFRTYFRDQVKHVDDNFRTIADRDHRAITGLSMGGLTAYYIAGQNKDLVSSVSAFDPADNIPLYGPKGHQVVLPVLEMYRSLIGLPVRLTMSDGDWLKYNDWEMKRIFEAVDLSYFEFHMADYPDHWAADADKQLDFHMKEFQQPHSIPDNWNHVCPAFSSFEVWGYEINVQRSKPALTLMENVSPDHMKILSRRFIPDGPIVEEEVISITTDNIYSPSHSYKLITYNLSNNQIDSRNIEASEDGKLEFELSGGGHIIGINGEGTGTGTDLRIVHKQNKEYYFFEVGKSSHLDFKLINLGINNAENIRVKAFSSHPFIHFEDSIIQISTISSADYLDLYDKFNFCISQYTDSSFVGTMYFELSVNGELEDIQKIVFFSVPETPYIKDKADILILDGRIVHDIPLYIQGYDSVYYKSLSGGEGNGDGILNRGEDALIYIRLPQGMAPKDTNTFHRSYLINHLEDPFIHVDHLNYVERLNQASMTSISTIVSITEDTPNDHEFDLWFKAESLYNDKNDTTSRATIYARQFDYRKAKITIGVDKPYHD